MEQCVLWFDFPLGRQAKCPLREYMEMEEENVSSHPKSAFYPQRAAHCLEKNGWRMNVLGNASLLEQFPNCTVYNPPGSQAKGKITCFRLWTL